MSLARALSTDTPVPVERSRIQSIAVEPRILVVSGFRAGSCKANAINTVKMAEGFANNGARVTLVTRAGTVRNQAEFVDAYGVQSRLRWQPVHSYLGHGLGLALRVWPIIRRFRPDVLFARNFAVPVLAAGLEVPTVFETHAHVGARGFWLQRAVRSTRLPQCYGLITISPILRDYYVSLGADPTKIQVVPTGVDLDRFRRPSDLPPSPYGTHGPNVTYSGHLYDYKGIPTILGAAAECPEANFHLVGGLTEDVERVAGIVARRGLRNVHLHGHKKHTELPPYLWHADVLLLPPSADHPSARWTSPVKLGEYMASETPIIATDIPAIRQLVDEHHVKFIAPDDAGQLAVGLQEMIRNPGAGRDMVPVARRCAASWSYKQRAALVMNLILASSCGSIPPAPCE